MNAPPRLSAIGLRCRQWRLVAVLSVGAAILVACTGPEAIAQKRSDLPPGLAPSNRPRTRTAPKVQPGPGAASARPPANAPRRPARTPAAKPRPKPPAGTLPKPVGLSGTDLVTRDGVQLGATFYPGTKDRDSVPVVLLHSWKGDRREFIRLAPYLQTLGHAVLVPDLRGHGMSTRQVQVVGGRPREKELDASRFRSQDFAAMVQYDMAAVRSFLLKKNNDGELNLNKLVLVGSEMGAAVAVEWAAYDWSLPNYEHAGIKQSQDVKALVLISPKSSFQGLRTSQTINHPAIRDRLSIMLLVGQAESREAGEVERIHKKLSLNRNDYSDLSPAEAAARRTLWFGRFDTKLQGPKLLNIPQLNIPSAIGRFIDLRVVKGEPKAEWLEHR